MNICPICGDRNDFESHGIENRKNVRCKSCNSLERHRSVFMYIADMLKPDMKILHIAPEKGLSDYLNKKCNNYLSIDIEPGTAMLAEDITNLNIRSNSFDLIICCDVLEHVKDDKKALSELSRVLKTNGKLILQTPIIGEKTINDKRIADPIDRQIIFGDLGHYRSYGKDIIGILKEAGLEYQIVKPSEIFPKSDFSKFVLSDREIILCTKDSEEIFQIQRNWMKISNRCSNDCKECIFAQEKLATLEDIKELAENPIEKNKEDDPDIVFYGGDIGTLKTLERYVNASKELGFKKIGIVSNGKIFSSKENCIKFVGYGVQRFIIYSFNDMIHNSFTENISIDQTIKGYNNLVDIGADVRHFKIPVKNMHLMECINETDKKLFLELTMRCNLTCKFCYQKNERSKTKNDISREEMDIENIKNTIRMINPQEVIITGGEPFVKKDIFELFDFLEQSLIEFQVYTNATLIDEAVSDRLKGYKSLKSMNISIDGDKEEHDRIRGAGNFCKTMDAIDRMKNSIKINLTTVICDNNLKDFMNIRRFAESRNLKLCVIPEEIISKKEKEDISKSLNIDQDQILMNASEYSNKIRRFVEEYLRNNNSRIQTPSFIKNISTGEYFSNFSKHKMTCKSICEPQIRINPKGELVFCRAIRKTFQINESIGQTLSSEEYQTFLKKVISNGDYVNLCRRCIKSIF